MNKLKIRSNWFRQGTPGRKIEGESLTVPEQAFSIREIFERSARGLLDTSYNDPQWDDNPEFDDVDMSKVANMDLAEIQDLRREILILEAQKVREENIKQRELDEAGQEQNAMEQAAPESDNNPTP